MHYGWKPSPDFLSLLSEDNMTKDFPSYNNEGTDQVSGSCEFSITAETSDPTLKQTEGLNNLNHSQFIFLVFDCGSLTGICFDHPEGHNQWTVHTQEMAENK